MGLLPAGSPGSPRAGLMGMNKAGLQVGEGVEWVCLSDCRFFCPWLPGKAGQAYLGGAVPRERGAHSGVYTVGGLPAYFSCTLR